MFRVLQECWQREGYVFLPRKVDGRWLETSPGFWARGGYQPMTVALTVDQYFSPLVFSEPHRRKQHALPTHVLWADLDEADPAQCRLRPSVSWMTTQGDISKGIKPHWQALWLLGHPLRSAEWNVERASKGGSGWKTRVEGYQRTSVSAEEAAQLSRRIAYAEPGADKSGWDVTQVLRLPGTFNHKHTPPQRITLLWAERRYYTVAEVERAYPPVPEHTTSVAHAAVDPGDVERAFRRLPVGLQMAIERESGGDRSLEIIKLATSILRFGVTPEMAVALLSRSRLAQDKYAGRRDMQQRLLTAVADAMLSLQ